MWEASRSVVHHERKVVDIKLVDLYFLAEETSFDQILILKVKILNTFCIDGSEGWCFENLLLILQTSL